MIFTKNGQVSKDDYRFVVGQTQNVSNNLSG